MSLRKVLTTIAVSVTALIIVLIVSASSYVFLMTKTDNLGQVTGKIRNFAIFSANEFVSGVDLGTSVSAGGGTYTFTNKRHCLVTVEIDEGLVKIKKPVSFCKTATTGQDIRLRKWLTTEWNGKKWVGYTE